MRDVLTIATSLRRPRLLIRAARFGVDDYRREPVLRRLLRCEKPPRAGAALMRLIEIEADLNARRIAHDADYSIARHVEILIALMGEARLLQLARRDGA